MVMIIGTRFCLVVLGEEEILVEQICGGGVSEMGSSLVSMALEPGNRGPETLLPGLSIARFRQNTVLPPNRRLIRGRNLRAGS